MSEPREWTISGGLSGDIEVARVDGPVPAVNERVRVIEYAAFEEMQDLFIKENDRYRQALERIVNLKLQRAQPLEEEIARAALEGKSE